MWEAASAVALVNAGADIIRMRHPKAVATVRKALKGLQG
jgi:CO dehydrogenase/acetyl-CoA synthase delta subunit